MISFVGAGPGAPDLITLRGANRLAEADIVICLPRCSITPGPQPRCTTRPP